MIIRAAGAIIFDEHRRLLLIRRGRPPQQGRWSVPGGKCDGDETSEAACIREVQEETGLVVGITRLAGSVARPTGQQDHEFVIDDFVCEVIGGALVAGDDAEAVRWCSRSDLERLELVDQLVEALDSWNLLPD